MLGLLNCFPCAPADGGEKRGRAKSSYPEDWSEGYLETLAREAGAAFSAGLQRLADEEQQRWKEERLRLQEEWQLLERSKQSFQEVLLEMGEAVPLQSAEAQRGDSPMSVAAEEASPNLSADLPDMVHLNVGGQAQVKISRAALTQCEGSRLALEFGPAGGEADLQKDADGHILIDFVPSVFLPLVDHLRMRHIEAFHLQQAQVQGQAPARQPLLPPLPLADPHLDHQFVEMLQYYGVLDWVYRQRPVDFKVRLGDYVYSVLPAQPPDMGQVLNEMRGFTVTVPRGWQVLNSLDDGFDRVIWELTKRCWGTSVLIAQEALGNYAGYRTPLSPNGVAGSVEAPARWFENVSEGGSKLRFGGLSSRVVIRSRAR